MTIRFMVETVTSKCDAYGSCYHYATITSTKTGKALRITNTGGESNASGLTQRAVDGWEGIRTNQSLIPIRQWNRANRVHKDMGAIYMHEAKPEMILALEE